MTMTNETGDPLLQRFQRVLEYIDANLTEDLDVERLSGVAAFSRFHFHRQFTACCGMGVAAYVQLRRMRLASYRLAYRSGTRVTEIALESGYGNAESFSRAFRKWMGQSPTGFRTDPDWEALAGIEKTTTELRSRIMSGREKHSDVEIVSFPETRVAVMEHRGDPRFLGNTIRRFIQWRKEHRLPPAKAATFNILYDDIEDTAPEDFRFALCVATEKEIAVDSSGIVFSTIPAGRCAVARHIGSDDRLRESVMSLYTGWLPGSGLQPRDFPLFLRRVAFFSDVPEHEAVTEIYLPVE